MALRTIRVEGDPVLNKKSRPVSEVNARLRELVTDMLETMYDTHGVGLAAPQVGVLKRVVVIDTDLEHYGEHPYILINPEIISTEGEQTGNEGCLSLPGLVGTVTRPMNVKVRARNLDMQEFELEGEGLLARAICHECDHLDGILYRQFAQGPLRDADEEEDEEEEEA